MAVAKAKAKKKAAPRKLDANVAEAVELFKAQTQARYRIARAAFDAQDEETQEVILAIIDRLRVSSSSTIRVYPRGKRSESVLVPIEPEYEDYNLMYVATEILKDLALMDVKVANYEFPKVFCAECGDKMTKKRRKKK